MPLLFDEAFAALSHFLSLLFRWDKVCGGDVLQEAYRRCRLGSAIETGRLPRCSGAVDAIDDIRDLTHHASRVNGTMSGAISPWRFNYLLLEYPQPRRFSIQSVLTLPKNCPSLP